MKVEGLQTIYSCISFIINTTLFTKEEEEDYEEDEEEGEDSYRLDWTWRAGLNSTIRNEGLLHHPHLLGLHMHTPSRLQNQSQSGHICIHLHN